MTSTYEKEGEIYTITIIPPFSGNMVQSSVPDLNYTVRVTDHTNREIYIGLISSLLAGYIEKSYKCSIPELLTHSAKMIIDGWSQR